MAKLLGVALNSPDAFYHNFTRELERAGRPLYRSESWKRALAIAAEADDEVAREAIRQRITGDYDVQALLVRRRQCGRDLRQAIDQWLAAHGL